MISDDKVGDKGVRVRCKKCGNIVTVRPKSEGEPTEPEREDTQVSGAPDEPLPEKTTVDQPEDQGEGFNVGDEEIGDALDSFLGDEGEDEDFDDDEDRPDFDRQATRVFSVDEMQKVQEEREQAEQEAEERQGISDLYQSAQADEQEASGEHPAAPQAVPQTEEPPAADEPSEEDREKVEWYAAVDEQQVGPMSITEIGTRWEQGEFDAETLVWKTGFDDWLPIFEVNELKFLVADHEQEAPPAEEEVDREETEEEEHEEASGWGDDTWSEEEEQEEDQADSDEEFYDEDDALSEASSAAFAGADVDWKPSAVAELNALAEEELASLKPPPDPEPEEEQLPFGEDLSSLPDVEDAEGSGEVPEMDDGDSSIIGQIAAEEEAAAKMAEEERAEEEKRQEEARKKQEEEELVAQEAARREREAEKRERAAPPPEQVIPPRGSIPKWALGVMGGSGLVIVVLLGFIAYKLASGSGDDEVKPAAEPIRPPAAAGVHTPPTGPAEAKPTPTPAPTPPGPTPTEVAKTTDTSPKAEVAETVKDEKKTDKPPKRKPPVSKKKKKKRRRKVAEKPKEVAPPPPPPEPKPPPSRKRKKSGSLLDFEDEAAFSNVTGSKDPVKKAPPPPVKKELPPLSNADVLGVMRQHIAEFKACNRKQKEIDPSVKGKMVVSFIVSPSGKVSSVKVTTARFKKTFVATCISKVIRQLGFPKFGGKPKKVPFPFTVK
jgi:hypothetical protein